jgi:hypothetical protein
MRYVVLRNVICFLLCDLDEMFIDFGATAT